MHLYLFSEIGLSYHSNYHYKQINQNLRVSSLSIVLESSTSIFLNISLTRFFKEEESLLDFYIILLFIHNAYTLEHEPI